MLWAIAFPQGDRWNIMHTTLAYRRRDAIDKFVASYKDAADPKYTKWRWWYRQNGLRAIKVKVEAVDG